MLHYITATFPDDLHWLPIRQRITYKLCTIVYKCLHGAAPSYLTVCSGCCQCCARFHDSAHLGLPVVRFAIARLRNHLEIVRPLWLVAYRDVYEHCSCKQCVLIVFEYHGQPHVCCLLILVYKYTFIESTNNDRSVEVIHGRACRKYRGIADIQGAETGKVCRCDNIWRTHQLKLMHIWNTGWNRKSSNWWPFQNPENALGPSRDCPKSWNGPTISRWLGRFRILKMPMGNLEIAQNPENARNMITLLVVCCISMVSSWFSVMSCSEITRLYS